MNTSSNFAPNPSGTVCLFDLDGVLIDTESIYTEFWHAMDCTYHTGIKDFVHVIKGTTLDNILNSYFPADFHQDIVRRLDNLEHSMPYVIKPGACELLRTLADRGIPAVMVTSSNDLKMSQLWKQHPDFRDYFRDIVTADMITQSKPDPEGYLLGAKIAGASAEHCCVFEDSLQGVMAGRNSGAYVIGVTGTIPVDQLEKYSDRIIDSLEEIDVDQLSKLLKTR